MEHRYKTTAEERKIIGKLPFLKIEMWAKNQEYWKIYREVIKETKKYYKNNKKIKEERKCSEEKKHQNLN